MPPAATVSACVHAHHAQTVCYLLFAVCCEREPRRARGGVAAWRKGRAEAWARALDEELRRNGLIDCPSTWGKASSAHGVWEAGENASQPPTSHSGCSGHLQDTLAGVHARLAGP